MGLSSIEELRPELLLIPDGFYRSFDSAPETVR
jgi:hypothetical protein